MAIWQGKRSLEVLTLTLQGEKFALEAGPPGTSVTLTRSRIS